MLDRWRQVLVRQGAGAGPPAGVIMAGGPRCPDWFAAAVAGVGANTGIFGNKKMAASMAAREEGDVQEG
ncbi:MAG: hypothetical protein ACRCVV_11625 [Shewanella sp.]